MFQGHQSDGNIHGNVMGISFHRNILLGYDGIHVVIILWVVVYQRVYIYIYHVISPSSTATKITEPNASERHRSPRHHRGLRSYRPPAACPCSKWAKSRCGKCTSGPPRRPWMLSGWILMVM